MLTFGNTVLGPLASEPKIEPLIEMYDCMIYENGKEAVASYVEKHEVKITVTTKNVCGALTLMKGYRKGDDLLSTGAHDALTFAPIVGEGVTEKTLIFPHALLLPEWSYVPSSTTDHTVRLIFRCMPDPDTGELFTYA